MAEGSSKNEGPARKKLKLSIDKRDRPTWHEALDTEEAPDEPKTVTTSAGEDKSLQPSSSTVYSEAYYSANFKAVLKSVLSSSPERHVIDEELAKIVEKFTHLAGSTGVVYLQYSAMFTIM